MNVGTELEVNVDITSNT